MSITATHNPLCQAHQHVFTTNRSKVAPADELRFDDLASLYAEAVVEARWAEIAENLTNKGIIETKPGVDPEKRIPSDPMHVLLSFLSPSEIAKSSVASKGWKKIADEEIVWKESAVNNYGLPAKLEKIISPEKSWKVIAVELFQQHRCTDKINLFHQLVASRAIGMGTSNYASAETVRPETGMLAGRKITVYKPV